MKISRYNFYINHDDKIITFNSLNRKVLVTDYFEPSDSGLLKYCKQNKQIKKLFVENRMLISIFDNQKKEFKANIKRSQFPDEMYVRILLSYRCNFKCSYCYEGIDKNSEPFLFKTVEPKEVKDFLITLARKKGIKTLILSWYGGEPFLYLKEIIKFSKDISRLLADYNIKYEGEIITNGSYEGVEYDWKQLALSGIKTIIFSIDGYRNLHNKNRPYINNTDKNQYGILLNNAKIWTKYGVSVLSIMLRNSRISQYEKIIDDIKCNIGTKNVSILLGKVSDINNNLDQTIRKEILSHKLFMEYKLNLYSYAMQQGFYIPSHRFLPFFNGCIEMLETGYSITPNGDIYECHESICNEKNVVSHIQDYTNLLSKRQKKKFPSSINDNYCCRCRFLPICKGGCPKRFFERKRHLCFFKTEDGVVLTKPQYKDIFEMAIKLYLYTIKNKESLK